MVRESILLRMQSINNVSQVNSNENDDSNDTGYNYDGDDDLVNEDGTETGLLQKVL